VVWKRAFGESEFGEFDVAWDGRDANGRRAPPGIYFARLNAWGTGASRRFVIIGSSAP